MAPLLDRLRAALTDRPPLRPSEDLRLIAQTYGFLYLAGALIALISIALPHDPDRSVAGALAVIAWAAGTGGLFLARADRLPAWLLRANPMISAAMVSLFIIATGGGTAGAYAMYMVWVVGPASYFFSFTVAVISILIACAGYAIAIWTSDTPLSETFLYMAVTTLLVAAALMAVLRRQVDGLIAHLADLSRTDHLTGLANRRALDQRLREELERGQRAGDRPIALVMLDIDDFKRVNDELGHQAGDRCLVTVAAILEDETRSGDLAARAGGEEFLVLMPETDALEAVRLAGRIRRRVAAAFEDSTVPLSISAGIAQFPRDAAGAAALIESADLALYTAKRRGKDRAVDYVELPDSSRASSTK